MLHFMRIHTVPTEEEGSTWLQLFFDLVYVAILVELGNRLGNNLDFQGIFSFFLLFIPIWWSWLEFVDYGSRYPVDDIGQRILTLLYMAVMLLMAFEIHALTGTSAKTFILTYGLSKLVLALMYARAWTHYPTYRYLTSHQATVFAVVGFVWIAIAFIAPTNLWLWGLATLLGVLAPVIISLLHRITHRADRIKPPIKQHFTLHRFGELTIIVLGEFFIKLATSSEGRELTLVNYLVGASLLGISVSLWWLYFDHLEHASLSRAGSRVGVWVYSHYPFLAAITAYGVVGNKIFAAIPRQPLGDTKRLLFTIMLAIALIAFGFIEWVSMEKDEPLSRKAQPWIRVSGAAALLAVGLFGSSLNVGWLVLIVATILLLQVALDVNKRLKRPEPNIAQNTITHDNALGV